jgi:F-type H+-transporting ATPase subunit a
MWIIMIPIELIGLFVKPFALALRLFANMTGGHLVIAVLLGFVPALMVNLGGVSGTSLSIVVIIGTTAINLLELLVAFIQAFIFAFLVCMFLGQLVVHDEEHGEHHGVHEEKHHAAGVNVESIEQVANHPQIANSNAAGVH